jgi:anthranilate synthase/aminodeoxychorismate synthase-like glutamine amidotransferase
MILLIDNYDSFTYNLVSYLHELGQEVVIIKNDEELPDLSKFDGVVVSPGPDSPEDSNLLLEHLQTILKKETPILGVCLGHQALGVLAGSTLTRSMKPMHGMAANIHHPNEDIYKDIPNPFKAIRYNSLTLDASTSKNLEVIALSEDGEIMGIKMVDTPAWGVQFHPESIGSTFGHQLLQNWLEMSRPDD